MKKPRIRVIQMSEVNATMFWIAVNLETDPAFVLNARGRESPIENSEILRMMRGKAPATKRHAAVLAEALRRLEAALPQDQWPADVVRPQFATAMAAGGNRSRILH